MFVDKVKIKVEAGSGGDGVVSFIREKYMPLGGPGGGDGGHGGHIILEADQGTGTLLGLKYSKKLKGNNGGKGSGKNCHGKSAEDTIEKVPLGTVVKNLTTGKIIADLKEHGQQVIIARGGRGGRGNSRFASARIPAPKICENGEPGEVFEIELEMMILADAGLVGFPSVGKSTFISVVSNARPDIADYHFTTINPNLGLTKTSDGRSFVIADLPGLIEGASLGKGLGHQFLRHIERCKVIIHVIDMGAEDGRDPVSDYEIINNELSSYNYKLEERPQIVVANKMDLDGAKENLVRFKKAYPDLEVFEIITFMKEGLDEVLHKTADYIEIANEIDIFDKTEENRGHHVYKFESTKPFIVRQTPDGY
jgi:GTP-binding protein